jgi:hypothetical protein
MRKMKRLLSSALCAAALGLFASSAHAQWGYPTYPNYYYYPQVTPVYYPVYGQQMAAYQSPYAVPQAPQVPQTVQVQAQEQAPVMIVQKAKPEMVPPPAGAVPAPAPVHSTPAACCGPSCGSHCAAAPQLCNSHDCKPEQKRGGITGHAEWLYLRATLDHTDFTILDPNTNAAPEGPVQAVSPLPFESGFRVGLGYVAPGGLDFMVNYMRLVTSSRILAIPPAGGGVAVTRLHPDNGFETASTATADLQLKVRVYDFEVGMRPEMPERFWVRLFGGLRIADIDQYFTIFYQGQDVGAAGALVNLPVIMNGFGLRVGGEAQWRTPSGVFLMGRCAATAMVGFFHTRNASLIFPAEVDANVTEDFNQFVPVLEVAGGLGWRRGPFSICAGYELTNYFNFAQRSQSVDALADHLMTRATGNLGLDGVFVRAGWTY